MGTKKIDTRIVAKRSRGSISVALSLVFVAACGGGSTDVADSTDPSVVVESPTPTGDVETPTSSEQTATFVDQWERVQAPEDCMCADGTPWSYFVREADPAKVVFMLDGGGACFSADMCAPGSDQYKQVIGYEGGFTEANGIFDLDNPENPFAEYSMVFVPYCTGDVHAGNITKDYGNGVVIEHKGFVNGSTALNDLVKRFPDVEDLVVAGVSAGSFPSAIYAGLAADQLPNTRIKVVADGSGAIPDAMGLVTSNWDVLSTLPDWPEFAGATYDKVTPSWLFEVVAARNPSIAFARHDYAFDNVLASYAALAGLAADDLVSVMRANETKVESTGAVVATWIAPGSDHTILQRPSMYTELLDGVRFVEWLKSFLGGESVEDHVCTDCAP